MLRVLREILLSLTVDKIVGTGLVLALVLSLYTGGATEMQTTIASGLVGWMSRGALEHERREETNGKTSKH